MIYPNNPCTGKQGFFPGQDLKGNLTLWNLHCVAFLGIGPNSEQQHLNILHKEILKATLLILFTLNRHFNLLTHHDHHHDHDDEFLVLFSFFQSQIMIVA